MDLSYLNWPRMGKSACISSATAFLTLLSTIHPQYVVPVCAREREIIYIARMRCVLCAFRLHFVQIWAWAQQISPSLGIWVSQQPCLPNIKSLIGLTGSNLRSNSWKKRKIYWCMKKSVIHIKDKFQIYLSNKPVTKQCWCKVSSLYLKRLSFEKETKKIQTQMSEFWDFYFSLTAKPFKVETWNFPQTILSYLLTYPMHWLRSTSYINQLHFFQSVWASFGSSNPCYGRVGQHSELN